jgi:hypothetical protein
MLELHVVNLILRQPLEKFVTVEIDGCVVVVYASFNPTSLTEVHQQLAEQLFVIELLRPHNG